MVSTQATRGRPVDPARRQKRIAEATEAALALCLAQGLDNVTIDAIVARVGWSKGNFYRYFEHKEALLASVYDALAQQLGDAFARLHSELRDKTTAQDLRGAHERFGGELVLVLLQDPAAARLYLQERHGPSVGARRPLARLAERVEADALKAATLAAARGALSDADPRLVALATVGAIEHVLRTFLAQRLPGDPAALAAGLTHIVLNGILKH